MTVGLRPALGVARPKVRRRAWSQRISAGQPRPAEDLGRATRGFTLMELLLVLVLLVIAGSIAMPAITGAFSSVKLRRAGDAVITRWAEARAQAVESGIVYQFRFMPESGRYRLEPWSALGEELPTSETASSTTRPETPATRKHLDQSPTIEAQLPETIVFHGGQAAIDEPLSGERRVDSLQSAESAWSTPILFFPNGTASQATIVLASEAPQYLRLTIRGLTGVARASSVLTREEMDQGAQTR